MQMSLPWRHTRVRNCLQIPTWYPVGHENDRGIIEFMENFQVQSNELHRRPKDVLKCSPKFIIKPNDRWTMHHDTCLFHSS